MAGSWRKRKEKALSVCEIRDRSSPRSNGRKSSDSERGVQKRIRGKQSSRKDHAKMIKRGGDKACSTELRGFVEWACTSGMFVARAGISLASDRGRSLVAPGAHRCACRAGLLRAEQCRLVAEAVEANARVGSFFAKNTLAVALELSASSIEHALLGQQTRGAQRTGCKPQGTASPTRLRSFRRIASRRALDVFSLSEVGSVGFREVASNALRSVEQAVALHHHSRGCRPPEHSRAVRPHGEERRSTALGPESTKATDRNGPH